MDKLLKILHLEDNPLDADLIQRELKKVGFTFEARVTDDLDTFIELAGSFQPDLILSDFSLPGFTGMKALQQLRDNGFSIPFILVTGKLDDETAVECILQGASEYVLKDNPVRLKPAIEHAIEKQRFERELDEAQKVVQQKEEYYRTMLHSMHEDILVISQDYVVTDVNNTYVKSVEKTRDEIVGQKCYEVLHGLDKPCDTNDTACQIKQVLTTNTSCQYRHQHLDQAGNERWIDILLSPLTIDGELTHVIEAARDVTEQVQAEKETAESRKRFQSLFENSLAAIVITDNEGNYTHVNQAACEVLGYTKDQLLAMSVADLQTAIPLTSELQFKQYVETGPSQGVFHYIHPDGKQRTLLYTAFPISESEHASVLRDITEMREAQDALRKSEELLQETGEMARVGGWEIDLASNHVIWTKTTKLIHEVDLDEDPLVEDAIRFYHPEDRPKIEEALRRAREEGSPYDNELRFITAKGKHLWVRSIGKPVFKDGKCIRLSGTFQDITAQKEAEIALRKSEELLQETGEMARVGGWEIDLETNNVFWTKTTKMIHEVDLDKVPTVDEALSFYTPSDRPIIEKAVLRAREEGIAYDVVVRFITAKGNHRWARAIGKPIFRNGTCVRLSGTFQDITDSKETEFALRDSERILKMTGKVGHIGGWEHDLITGKAVWTEALYDIIELPHDEEPPGVDEHWDYYDHKDRKRLRHHYNNAIEENTPFEIELRVNTRSGKTLWCRVRGEPYAIDGEVVKLRGTFQDITTRKEAELALRQSEQKYRIIADNTIDVIWQMSLDAVVTYVNPAIERVFGYTPEEFTGTLLREHVDEQNFEIMAGVIQNAINTLPDFTEALFEAKMFRKDGREIFVEILGRVIVDADGNPTFLQGVTRDITERKKAEEKLRQSEAKYRSIVEQSEDAIYVMHNDNFLMVNDKFRELFAVTDDDLDNPDFRMLDLVAPESRDLVQERQRQRDQGLSPQPRYEFKGLTLDGRLIDIEASTIAIDFAGKPAVQGILRDVSEQKQLSRELLQAQKMESIGRLAGGVAHDFNNLLTVISGTLDIMIITMEDENPLREDLGELQEAADRAAALTRQLLSFSRKQERNPRSLSINDIIQNLNKMLTRIIGEDIMMHVDVAEDIHTILADPAQLEQIIVNLVVNARDAMPRGGRLTIRTRNHTISQVFPLNGQLVHPGDYISLEVEDTGCGIQSNIMASIFEPFFTTKEEGKGTGLGLSTVYGIVKQNDGYIRVKSELDKGTQFSILFPCQLENTADEDDHEHNEQFKKGSETILVVEDDPNLLRLIKRMLGKAGYDVHSAQSGVEAISLIEEENLDPDLILTDIIMPKMNGVQMNETLRKRIPNLKIIYMSGYSENVVTQSGVINRNVPFLKKPFKSHEITKLIRDVLDDIVQQNSFQDDPGGP